MEIPDIHVRVLFDFEYPTRDGKNVTIKEGEKLYLIKKTNEDWWQVIRNSGRPFYVPASYVEEISRTGSKHDRKYDTVRESMMPRTQAPTDTYRMRSSSVDTQPTHDKIKPLIPKRTIFIDTQRNHNREPTPVITPNADCKDEEVDYVNIDKQNIELNVHSEVSVNKTNHDLDKTMSLSASNNDPKSNNVSNLITSDDDTFTNGYSHVHFRSCNIPTIDNQLPINLSNSLEELSQEIEKKTRIGKQSDTSYSRIDNIFKSISKDMPVPAKNINEAGNSGLKQVNNNCESFIPCRNDNELKNKLHYSGSFKTKHEREKWAKNYVIGMQSMREEDFQTDNSASPIENDIPAGNNDSNNNLNNIASSVAKLSSDNLNNTSTIKSDSSSGICTKSDNGDVDSVKSDKNCDAKISSPVTNEEKIDVHVSTSSSISDNMKIYFDSSTEDLDKNPTNWSGSRLTPSDKGSTDSLLDVDTQYSVQEELSICTTASDSLLHTSDTSEDGLSGILREEPSPDDNRHKKKPALKRNKRVESCRLRFPIRGVSPPVPEEHQLPSRELFNGWCEYTFTDGRTFFYNSRTGEKSWKPPRRRCNTDDKNSKLSGSTCYIYSGSSSPLAEVDENHGDGPGGGGGLGGVDDDSVFEKDGYFNIVPKGWRIEVDPEKGCKCFVNLVTGAKWFYSIDDEGRVYYFEENSTESSWTLPVAGSSAFNEKTEDQSQSQPDHVYSNLPVITRSSITPNENTVTATDNSRNRAIKSKSMILMEPKNEDPPVSFSSQKWPQLNNGQMCILKEGTLNRTKITENAKRIRKNWASSYVALTELSLLFFKDHKSFTAWKNSGGQPPEMCVELNGALIDRGDKVSSRKNVYMISTLLGLQVLIQNDSTQQVDLWLEAIQSVIKKLPFGSDSCSRLTRTPPAHVDDASLETESKKNSKVTRSKSVKAKNKDGSMEDLTVSSAERQTKIKAKLKKFFHRRPTMESLVKKGIWKDEPAFGCFLSQVAGNETPRVPLFVQRCINCIEKSEENMKTDGLYRASGNLSQVQKIRLQVDQNNLSVIEEEEDVHVLTGALKLFFRELKEPLIPYQLFQKAIKAAHNHNKKEKISQFREIVKALPQANYDTLKFLLQHLLRISEYQEYNRMHIPNIAIVFGPTLMWPEQESNNMALDLMQQNLVIECLLVEFDKIFR